MGGRVANVMSFDFGENILRIGVRLDFAHDVLNDSLFVDDERGADDTHGNFSVQLLLLPDTVVLNRHKFRIGKQYERQVVLLGEFHMGFDTVFADADDCYVAFLEFVVVFREPDGLSRAARRIVLRIKVQDDFTAFEIRQGDSFSVFVLQREIGGVFSNVHNVFSVFVLPSIGRFCHQVNFENDVQYVSPNEMRAPMMAMIFNGPEYFQNFSERVQ